MNSRARFLLRILWSNLAKKFYIFLVIFMALFSLMNWYIMPWYVNDGGTVTVPDVAGLNEVEARHALDTLGLQFQLGGTKESKLPPNTVLSQNPEAGSVVKHGRRVYLVLSGGVERSSIPDLQGHTQREAQFMLERAGFRLGSVTSDSSSAFPQNVVMSQSIPPNTMAVSGTMVAIIVSSGPPVAGQVAIPDLVGRPLSEAQKIISNSGFILGKITFQPSTKLVPNTVLEQYPRSNEPAARGTHIDLFVSSIASQKQVKEN
ncbi:MAG TPA: PASTA domain-containing protein [Candidatus Acidoferrales bacterium]|nr:PASTA domain-containing protein [Candidatus Acidoferrales bacterium]